MPRRKPGPAVAPIDEKQMDMKKRTRELKKHVDADSKAEDTAAHTSSADSEPPTKKRRRARNDTNAATKKSKAKTKGKLLEEGVKARKELKQKDVEIQELRKALEEKTRECEQEQRPKRKLAVQNMEMSQGESKDLLDDTFVRDELASLFQECNNFTADWARDGCIGKVLSREQILLTMKAVQEFPGLKCEFLSNTALEVIFYIPNGARLLLGSLLNHIMVDRIFEQPLLSIKKLMPGRSDLTYTYALNHFTREIRRHSVDDARLFQAHCVRMTKLLVDREQANEESDRHTYKDYHKWLAQNLLQSHAALLLNSSREGAPQEITQHLLEMFDQASKLSRQLWSQKTHISIWRHQHHELGLYPHLNNNIIKAHPATEPRSKSGSIFGRELHVLMRPAILASSIGEKNGGWKIWSNASGLIFSNDLREEIQQAASTLDAHEPHYSPDSKVDKEDGLITMASSEDPAIDSVAHSMKPGQKAFIRGVDIKMFLASNTETGSLPTVEAVDRVSFLAEKAEAQIVRVVEKKNEIPHRKQLKDTTRRFTIDLSNDSEDDSPSNISVKQESATDLNLVSSINKTPKSTETVVPKVNSWELNFRRYLGGDDSEVSTSMESVRSPSPCQPTKFSNSDSRADESSENGLVNSRLEDSKLQAYGRSSPSAIYGSTAEGVAKQADVLAGVSETSKSLRAQETIDLLRSSGQPVSSHTRRASF